MCFSIAKYLLFAFNFIFWLAGCAVLGVGIWMQVDPNFQQSLSAAGIEYALAGPIVFIVVGCIMIIFGFFGCCGAIKESTCLLTTYSVLLFIVFCVELGIGIWALVEYDSIDQAVLDGLFLTYPDDLNQDDVDRPIYATQQNLHCCGKNDTCRDWEGGKFYGCGCDINDEHCIKVPGGCEDMESGNSGIYDQSCSTAITNFVENNMIIIGAVGLAIAVAEILGIIVSCCLCQSIKKEKKGHHA